MSEPPCKIKRLKLRCDHSYARSSDHNVHDHAYNNLYICEKRTDDCQPRCRSQQYGKIFGVTHSSIPMDLSQHDMHTHMVPYLHSKALTDEQRCIINVKGDGNCFFRCVSVYMFGTEKLHQHIRRTIVSFMNEQSPISKPSGRRH
jgi:hypothetical protein